MTNTFESFRKDFFALVDASSSVIITSHYSPDDDSIGSVLSIYEIVTTKYSDKNIRIVYTGIPVERYKVFTNFEKIEWVDDVANHVPGVDLCIMLDGSQYARFSKDPEKLKSGASKNICIDHHASAMDMFTLLLSEPGATSTCELIYHAFEPILNKNLAESLLLGIIGDTGNFAYVPPAQSQVFLVAKELVEIVGTSIDAFRSRYMGIPKRVIPLLQELVKNTSYETVDGWPDVQYAFINRASITGYSDEDVSTASHIYLSQYLPKVLGYPWGFVITPRTDGTCRMSGRSLPGSVNVRDLHERMGIGGGHDRASGGYFTGSEPNDCVTKVLQWMKENKPLLG